MCEAPTPQLLVTIACVTSALALLVLGIIWTLAPPVAFRGNPLRVLALPSADPLATLETRGSRLIDSTTRDKKTITRGLKDGKRIMLLDIAVAGGVLLDARTLGTTGNVYTLSLGATQSCNCQAFIKKDATAVVQCKHLAWLKTEVLGVPANHYLVYQSTYSPLELKYMLGHIDRQGKLAPLAVREALGIAAARTDDATRCPICLLDLADFDLQPLRRCAAVCGAAYHAQCITDTHAYAAKEGKASLCPTCRHAWMDALTVGTRERAGVTYTTVTHPLGAASRRRSGSGGRRGK